MAIKQMVTPTAEYTPLPVKVMYQTDDFMKAREKLSKAEETSDLQTEAEDDNQLKKRTRRVNPRYESEDEETEDEEPISKKRSKVPVRKSPRKGKQKQRIPPPLPTLPEWPLSEDEDTNNLPPKTNQPQSKTTESERASTSSTLFEKSKSSQPSAMDVKMLTCLEHIKAQVHQNTRLLQALLKKSDAVQSVEEGEPNQFNIFPLKIKEDVDKLEEKLGDVEVTNQLVKNLCTIGGENVKSTVRRLLAFLFANDLAVRVNWKGKGGKIAFSSLRIKDIVTRTVRKNRLTAGATDSEICAIVKDWFRFASDRDGGRKKEEERKRMNEEKRKDNEKGGESGNDTD